MLGAQTWFVAFALPTVVVGSFIATRKRLAYQWRDELIDPSEPIYPTVTDNDMKFFRHVVPAEKVLECSTMKDAGKQWPCLEGDTLTATENKGWFISWYDPLETVFSDVCLEEVRQIASRFGIFTDSRKISTLASRLDLEVQQGELEPNALDISKYASIQIVSDHPEDTQLMKAPWGTGDALQTPKLPLALRFLSQQVQKVYPSIGRLRHVHILYSPSGEFFREPKSPKVFDGHDYVIIPLRRDRRETIITFVPSLRSKYPRFSDIMRYSWTNRDVDARVPNFGMLRVYGAARYDWGWGLRPGPSWWGSTFQPCGSIDNGETDPKKGFLSQVKDKLFSALGRVSTATFPEGSNEKDAAIVVLHFEGPRSKGKKRSLLFHPESLIFGYPPTVENYDVWQEDRPSEADIQEVGLIKYLAQNYFTMLKVS